ncbi:3-isopropylmalate dehydrogenase [hydrothermal vent metagenome]|uniref:3-isopropylmalate dehydrogenase n=1 Tax=hydrothermal vent metagenome TaxID=652676 RepID=A0A3B1BPD7_9ZZZZ
MAKKIAIIPGDGIGVEVVNAALKTLDRIDDKYSLGIETQRALVGGSAYEEHGTPLPDETLKLAKEADAILLGAVGGPKWEPLPYEVRPERALLALRSELDLFANLRPARVYPALADASSLKKEIVEGIDIMVVRELTGGIYFGKPKGVVKLPDGTKRGINTLVYTTPEIERIAKVAFDVARKRSGRVTSVDKANVLECTELWRETVTGVHKNYQDVELGHMYVDNCAMQLVRAPKQFDVIVTTNLFGDILSDEAAMLTGSIGMLPSASLSGAKGMFEPVHGSAPDIAGLGKANPSATILSVAMMLKYSFGEEEAANDIERAVEKTLDAGYRTPDIFTEGRTLVGTDEMGDKIMEAIG